MKIKRMQACTNKGNLLILYSMHLQAQLPMSRVWTSLYFMKYYWALFMQTETPLSTNQNV